MALTSLAAQLKKLEAPQTNLLYHRKSKPSLLFDPKEAATFDRDTFYELGLSGLEELKKLNPLFSAFENTLFDVASKSFERSVETPETNRKLDHQIQTFLILLSPYFLLKSAHKALEWLINRYHIQDFNVEDILFLCLPYHETGMFGRMVSLLRIDDNDPSWCWLKPVQKEASPLSKSALLNRASTDLAFLKFVCNMPARAIKINGNKASSLGTLYAFYCTTVIGSLEHANPVTELHVSHLLPSVMAALSSSVLDFTASAYMIIARLSTKTGVGNKLLQGFYNKIAKVEHQKLRAETTLILVLLAQNDQNGDAASPMSEKAVRRLIAASKWFVPNLARLSSNQVVVTPLVTSVLTTALAMYVRSKPRRKQNNKTSNTDNNHKQDEEAQENNTSSNQVAADDNETNDDSCEEIKQFVNRLLEEVRFQEDADSEQIFRCILEAYDQKEFRRDQFNWLVHVLRSLEVKYPTGYDNVISSALATRGTNLFIAVKRLLGENTSRNDLFQKLIHSNPDIRIEAIRHIAQHFKPNRLAWLRESLEERLSESNERVVLAMLELSEHLLNAIAPKNLVVEHLVRIVVRWRKCETQCQKEVVKRALELLLSQAPHRRALILLLLFPFLVDSSANHVHHLVAESSSLNSWPLMKLVRTNLLNDIPGCETLWKVLEEEGQLVPSCKEIFRSMEEVEACLGGRGRVPNVYRLVGIVLTAGSIAHRQPQPSLVNSVIHRIIDYISSPDLCGDGNCGEVDEMSMEMLVSWSLEDNVLPVEGVLYCLSALVRGITPIMTTTEESSGEEGPPALPWIDFQQTRHCLLLANFRIIVQGLSSPQQSIANAFSHLAKTFFENYFKGRMMTVNFLMSSLLFEPSLGAVCLRMTLDELKRHKSLQKEFLAADSVAVPCLLIFLNSPSLEIRQEAINIVKHLVKSARGTKAFYRPLFDELSAYLKEIEMDPDQLAVALYMKLSQSDEVKSLLSEELAVEMNSTLDQLIAMVLNASTPLLVKAKLLQLLESVNSEKLCLQLIPVVEELLERGGGGGGGQSLSELESLIVLNIVARLNADTVSLYNHDHFWAFAQRLIHDQATPLLNSDDSKRILPAVAFMNQISKQLFENLPSPIEASQERLLGMVISECAEAESAEVASGLASLFKRIALDSKILVSLFSPMLSVTLPQQNQQKNKLRKSLSTTPSLEVLETSEWKRGVCLLELIQGKKKLTNMQLLLPRLFEILNKCLMFEQQSPVEYTKQLVLSLVLHCCEQLSSDQLENGDLLQVELIVQCVRASHNPQTHHHALLALTHMAHLLPERVLHNIIAIFTFIGSSVLRQDDAYSFQIISKIVDTIVPILIKRGSSEDEDCVVEVAGVVRVFVGAMMDIPEHRRLALLGRLLNTLNSGRYLWLFLCLVFESHVLRPTHPDDKSKGLGGGEHGAMPRRLEVALQLCFEFPPEVVLNTCYKLLTHLIVMPHEKDDNVAKDKWKTLKAIFDIEANTGKQLRHYKYTLLMFLSSLISSQNFVQQIAGLSEEEMKELESVLSAVIEQCLVYVKSITKVAEENTNPQAAKYWKAMLNQSYDVLDKTNALLPTELFLSVVGSLVKEGQDPVLRRKAMELIGWKLQEGSSMSGIDEAPLLALVDPIVDIVRTIQPASQEPSQESQLAHQTALFALKLITRHLAPSNISLFQDILGTLTDIVCWKDNAPWCVLGSLVLCLSELVSTLKAHSIRHLSKFMPALIKIMSRHLKQHQSISNSEVVTASLVTGLLKIVEVLARFLSPYLSQIIFQVCVMSALYSPAAQQTTTATTTSGQVPPLQHKLKAIRTKISSQVESRVLIPGVSKCFKNLMEERHYGAVTHLMSLLSDSFVSSSDLTPELVAFFLDALDVRTHLADSCEDVEEEEAAVAQVEGPVISALTAIVLKLSESTFRPLYYRIYDWAIQRPHQQQRCSNERAITFYRLSHRFAESLKSLFALFAGHCVSNAALLLDKSNTEKSTNGERTTTTSLFEKGDSVRKCCELVEAILSTLLTVFTYDSHQFVNKERFDALSQPLVDQLENRLGGEEVCSGRNKMLSNCLSQMAVSIGDDALWKQLNYQILLKTRHPLPQVRLGALKTVLGIAQKLNENFMPLLPETVPFLAELLEDDEEEIEKECQRVVAEMETILGEPIQKYF